MKTLFSGAGFTMNDDARSLDRELFEATRPIFDKYVAMGYSPREVSHILYGVAFDHEVDVALGLRFNPEKDV